MIAALAMGGALLAAVVAWFAFGAWGVATVAVCVLAALAAVILIGPGVTRPHGDNRFN